MAAGTIAISRVAAGIAGNPKEASELLRDHLAKRLVAGHWCLVLQAMPLLFVLPFVPLLLLLSARS